MDRWSGKVAIVTGTSAGIGAATVKKLVQHGVIVVGLARREAKLKELQQELGDRAKLFHPIKADISNEDEVLAAFAWIKQNLGPVHIAINNAGIRRHTNIVEGNTEMWREIINTNVVGLCVVTREAVKDMRANNVDGHIIHMNSVTGHKVIYFAQSSVYPATKYAVTALTETLRQELNLLGSKIKVTSISPGVVDTEFRSVAGAYDGLDQVGWSKIFAHLKSDDVADAVIYVLGTPPHVQVHELTIKPVGEKW